MSNEQNNPVSESVGKLMEEALRRGLKADSEKLELSIEPSDNYKEPPQLSPEIIPGVLRQGHKMVFAGPPTAGKTSILINLALAFAHGKEWLGFPLNKTSVLYVNLELSSESFVYRVHEVAKQMGVEPYSKRLAYIHHRGGILDPKSFTTILKQRLVEAKKEGKDYRVVIIDPMYKMVGGGGNDEQSNQKVSTLVSGLFSITTDGNISFIFSVSVNNNNPLYQITEELQNGTGHLARDADATLMLWPLENHPDGFRLKGNLREFEYFKPKSLAFTYPVFTEDTELDKVPQLGIATMLIEEEEKTLGGKNFWKTWEKINPTGGPLSIKTFAQAVELSEYEVRVKLLTLEGNPSNTQQRLRMKGNSEVVMDIDED
jgi:archaellum biogenesis ATPase FlaH